MGVRTRHPLLFTPHRLESRVLRARCDSMDNPEDQYLVDMGHIPRGYLGMRGMSLAGVDTLSIPIGVSAGELRPSCRILPLRPMIGPSCAGRSGHSLMRRAIRAYSESNTPALHGMPVVILRCCGTRPG